MCISKEMQKNLIDDSKNWMRCSYHMRAPLHKSLRRAREATFTNSGCSIRNLLYLFFVML